MKENKFLAAITALALCIMIPVFALGDVTARSTEENGRIKETVWEDENGQLSAGPEGYSIVRFTYDREGNTVENYFDENGNP